MTSGSRDTRITPHGNCRDYIWGGCRLENGGNPPKTNFKQVLDHLSGFENYTFFDFQKKFFSLHPITAYCKGGAKPKRKICLCKLSQS